MATTHKSSTSVTALQPVLQLGLITSLTLLDCVAHVRMQPNVTSERPLLTAHLGKHENCPQSPANSATGTPGSGSNRLDGSASSFINAAEFEARDMDEIDYFCGPVLIRDADGPPARHDPQKIRMRNLKSPLVGQMNCKRLERGLLPRLPDLFRSHAQIIIIPVGKVQPAWCDARVPAERPKLSDPAHEGARLQPRRDGRVRCSAWLGHGVMSLIIWSVSQTNQSGVASTRA